MSAKRTIAYLLLFLDCRVHPLHRHRRTRQVHHQVHHQVQLRSEVTSSHQETGRGRETTDSNDRLRDLPEWSEEFTDNLENAEMPAPAHISQDSDSERRTEVALRKHSIKTHFPKDRNCEVCLRTKMTRALCRRRTGEAVLRAEIYMTIALEIVTIPVSSWENRRSNIVKRLASHPRFQHEINQDFHPVSIDRGRNLERRYLESRLGRFGKVGCIRSLSSDNQRERSVDITEGKRIHTPSSRWYSKIVRKSTLRRQQTVRSEDLSGELQGEH